MLKSFSETLRSLWQQPPNEPNKSPDRKRKRPLDDAEESDSDVEIVSVKRSKQETNSSTTSFFSFLAHPMSKMSEWVRRKTPFPDAFFSQPLGPESHWRSESGTRAERHGLLNTNRGDISSLSPTNAANGSSSVLRNCEHFSRPSIHNRNGADSSGINGDLHLVDKHAQTDGSPESSRRSSVSSSRAWPWSKKKTVEQCFQLKEREEYLRLLQQHTSVDLGYCHNYHTARVPIHQNTVVNHEQIVCRKPSGVLPVPITTIRPHPGSHVIENSCTSRFIATPSRVLHTALPTPKNKATSTVNVPVKDSFLIPRIPERVALVHSQSRSRRTLLHESKPGSDETGQQRVSPPPSHETSDLIEHAEKSSSRKTPRSPPLLDFKSSEYLDEDWLSKMNHKYESSERERQLRIKEAEIQKRLLEEKRQSKLGNLDKKLREQMRLFDEEPEVIEETPLPEVPQEEVLPELTDEMMREIKIALDGGTPSQVLVDGFRLQITRADMATLHGLNWLNDEIINFYMNMLMERGEREGNPKVYAFNTFFYPKLTSGGHAAVRRWTRKVDVFSYHYLVIPVHLGVHWCLCVVFMKEKKIRYYDSMGGNNDQCLNAVRQYLYDESLEKRKIQLNLSEWCCEVVKDIPQQMNGSDCGMFSCMYAESITRGAKITFTQKDMPYFRRRMVYEILKKQLL